MKKLVAMPALLLTVLGLAAPPEVTVTETVQDATSREVTVKYTLAGAPAIITVNVQTNAGDSAWVDVDPGIVQYFAGDVHRRVEPGEHQIKWRPDKAWPGQNITDDRLRIGVSAWVTNAPPDYMTVDLLVPGTLRYYAQAETVPGGVTNDCYKKTVLLMRRIPSANVTWRMGSPSTEVGRKTDGREQIHEVTLTNDFYLGVYPITQRQYEIVMGGSRPSSCSSSYPLGPVERVTWENVRGMTSEGHDWPSDGHAVDDMSFMGRLRTLAGGGAFDLPTEAQWEFACRAGSSTAYYNDLDARNANMDSNLDLLACYARTSVEKNTCPVGRFLPNGWGLYDMLGNVFELTLDYYQVDITAIDYERGPATGAKRVSRGGCSGNQADWCRCAARDSATPTQVDAGIGFRVCLTLP